MQFKIITKDCLLKCDYLVAFYGLIFQTKRVVAIFNFKLSETCYWKMLKKSKNRFHHHHLVDEIHSCRGLARQMLLAKWNEVLFGIGFTCQKTKILSIQIVPLVVCWVNFIAGYMKTKDKGVKISDCHTGINDIKLEIEK